MVTLSNNDIAFNQWLQHVGLTFKDLTSHQKNQFLSSILSLADIPQVLYLTSKLQQYLQRDFITRLPPEVSLKIFGYLDLQSLAASCNVCMLWNRLISANKQLWFRGLLAAGICLPDDNTTDYSKYYLDNEKHLNKLTQSVDSFLYGHQGRVTALFFHKDKLATGSDDRTVKIWDCVTNHCLHTIATHTVADLKFDDEYVVTGSFDTTAACWNIADSTLERQYVGHVAAIFGIDFNVSSDIVVTGSADSTVKLWQFSSGHHLRTLTEHRSSWITQVSLVIDPASDTFGIASRDVSTVHVWNVAKADHSLLSSFEINVSGVTDVCDRHGAVYMMCEASNFVRVYRCCWPKGVSFDTSTTNSDCLLACHLSRDFVHALVGHGVQFSVFLTESCETHFLDVVLNSSGSIVQSLQLPAGMRVSKRGSTFKLATSNWLNGVTSALCRGPFCAFACRDNSVCVKSWFSEDTNVCVKR